MPANATTAPHGGRHTTTQHTPAFNLADYRACRDAGDLVDLPCGCQDVHYRCGYVSREHDYVVCDGEPVQHPPPPNRVGDGIEAGRTAAAARNGRMFGTDPSWYGR